MAKFRPSAPVSGVESLSAVVLEMPESVDLVTGEPVFKTPTEISDTADKPIDKPFSSSDSEFQATPEESRKAFKKGRPNNEAERRVYLDPNKPMPVPTPPYRTFKSDSTHPAQRSKGGFTWWNSLPTWAKDHIEVYVYREHPVLLEPPIDEETRKPKWWKYVDKVIGNEPFLDDLDLLQRYGCGSYKLDVNEVTDRKSGDSRTKCQIYVLHVGGGDYKSNPPTDKRVSDVKQVDLTHPANTSYVAYLRGKGLLPDQREQERENEDMATAQMIDKVLDQNANLTAQLTKREPAAATPQQAPADAKLVELLVDGARRSNEMVQDASTKANEIITKARADADAQRSAQTVVSLAAPAAPAVDPLTQALAIMEIINKRGSTSDAEMAQLRMQIQQMQMDQVKTLSAQVDKLLDTKTVQPNSPFGAVKEGLQAMKDFKSTYEDMTGGNEKDSNPVEEAVDAVAPKWMKTWMPIITMGMNLATTFFQSKMAPQTSQYMPVPGYPPQQPYGPPPQYVGPGGGYGPQPMPAPSQAPKPWQTAPAPTTANGGNGGNGLALVPTGDAPGMPNGAGEPPTLPPDVIQLLEVIKIPFFSHLNIDASGAMLADWFFRKLGEDTYKEVAAMGPEAILNALRTYPPIAGPLQAYKPEVVEKFVKEFCDPPPDEDEDYDEDQTLPVNPGGTV